MKISEIPISQLVRLLPEALCTPSDALQASVARHGVLAAPVVCDGILCDGHRRLSAARKAGITSLMCREITGNPGLLFAELNSNRELTPYEAAAVYANLDSASQKAFLEQTGLSESPQMGFALNYIARQILCQPDLLTYSLPINVWRELGHLGEAIRRFAIPLLTLPGTAAEKRNIAALLRQAMRRNELPSSLTGQCAAEVIDNLQKIAQPRRSAALEKFQEAIASSGLPPATSLKIDQTFAMPGIHLSMQITRQHTSRLDQARIAIESIFSAVEEL